MYMCQKAIITGLEDTEHTVTITTVAPNANATDAAFGIGYFLVDRELYEKRLDLLLCGRTLFGAPPPRGRCFSEGCRRLA